VYDTLSDAGTQWGLIELAKRPDIQIALRKELREKYSTADPTYDELTTDLPLLDAVIHETLRLHPAVPDDMGTREVEFLPPGRMAT
jgi:cytochrome P450